MPNLTSFVAFKKVFSQGSDQGCSLGLDVSVSRRSRDPFFKCLGLVSVSENFGGSRSRLGQKAKRLGLVSVSELKVSFTSDIFHTVEHELLTQYQGIIWANL